MARRSIGFAFLACLLTVSVSTPAEETSDTLARDIFKELIEINTTESSGNTTAAAQAVARRLRDAGYPAQDVQVVGANDRKKNLVARLRGSGRHPPILLIGHLDVVEARREDWSTDPFQFVEKDGNFYGRGTQDTKGGDAIMVAALIRLKKEGFRPSRDIILALTADEETGDANGVDWLLKNRRELVDAQFVLNTDGASVTSERGVAQYFGVDAAEKIYADYQLSTANPGGHSSRPVPENAIYELVAGLARLGTHEFPFELNDVTRAYYERMAAIEGGQRAADMRAILRTPPDPQAIGRLSRDPLDHATLHTTCVATRLEAGHANNALPQRAQATVNCRILPGHSPEEVRQDLIGVLADPKITVRYITSDGRVTDTASDGLRSSPPVLRADVMRPLEKLVAATWHGIPVIPTMSVGASDGVYTNAAGLPTYLVSGIAIDRDDNRAHGQDERLGIESFYRGNEFFYQYLKVLTRN